MIRSLGFVTDILGALSFSWLILKERFGLNVIVAVPFVLRFDVEVEEIFVFKFLVAKRAFKPFLLKCIPCFEAPRVSEGSLVGHA